MIRRPPRSTRTDTRFPTRRSSDLSKAWREGQLCLVPLMAFYEPNWETGKHIRYRIGMADGSPFAVAGLWREWKETDGTTRSEEHTSELQSLMRISYAVLCLKKKNKLYNQSTMERCKD